MHTAQRIASQSLRSPGERNCTVWTISRFSNEKGVSDLFSWNMRNNGMEGRKHSMQDHPLDILSLGGGRPNQCLSLLDTATLGVRHSSLITKSMLDLHNGDREREADRSISLVHVYDISPSLLSLCPVRGSNEASQQSIFKVSISNAFPLPFPGISRIPPLALYLFFDGSEA